MRITFIGGDHEVTGSCHYVNANGKSMLLDYGMEQGRDVYENQQIPVLENYIDYVFLSHAHIDHSGLIPLLYKNGFKGKIYATEATVDLCKIMLRDSAHIQEFEAEWKNRKGKRAGSTIIEPLYTMEDAEGVLGHFIPCAYGDMVEVCEGIKIRFTDIGHLLGSACIELWLEENGVEKKIVYSGDIGNINQPIIEDPSYIEEADYVIMESTYGNRTHGEAPDYIKDLSSIMQTTFDRGGNLVIPAFAVGRTQEMLYFIRQIKEEGLVKGHDGFKVYIDSPLAIEAVKVFNKNIYTCFDEAALELVKKGEDPISFPGLKVAVSPQESQAINFDPQPKVILSASGMCDAGRVRHHLKHNLWRKDSTILFVGYQALGSLGRIIVDGATSVKLFNEEIDIKAHIEKLDGISGHADKTGLINWINGFTVKPKQVFVVHGDDLVVEEFSMCLKDEHGYNVYCPYSGASFDCIENKVLNHGVKIPIERKNVSEGRVTANRLDDRLSQVQGQFLKAVAKAKNGTNRDKEKVIEELLKACKMLEI